MAHSYTDACCLFAGVWFSFLVACTLQPWSCRIWLLFCWYSLAINLTSHELKKLSKIWNPPIEGTCTGKFMMLNIWRCPNTIKIILLRHGKQNTPVTVYDLDPYWGKKNTASLINSPVDCDKIRSTIRYKQGIREIEHLFISHGYCWQGSLFWKCDSCSALETLRHLCIYVKCIHCQNTKRNFSQYHCLTKHYLWTRPKMQANTSYRCHWQIVHSGISLLNSFSHRVRKYHTLQQNHFSQRRHFSRFWFAASQEMSVYRGRNMKTQQKLSNPSDRLRNGISINRSWLILISSSVNLSTT